MIEEIKTPAVAGALMSRLRKNSRDDQIPDPYPSVVDTLGALTGGELVNGTEEDFVPIE